MTHFVIACVVLAVWAGTAMANPRSVRRDVEPLDAPATPTASAVADAAGAPFVLAEYYDVDPACRSFAIGDFDGDGHDDIALAEPGSSGIGLLMNDGADRFVRDGLLPLSAAPTVVIAADFNQDGVDDLAAALEGGGLAVFMTSGAGSPVARDRRRRDKTLLGEAEVFDVAARLLATGDLDGDGRPDLVAAEDGPWLSVLITRGHKLRAPERHALEKPADAVAVGDMDADGFEDVVVHATDDMHVDVLGGAPGGLRPAIEVALPLAWMPPQLASMIAADFDGDGDADLVLQSIFPLGHTYFTVWGFWNDRSSSPPERPRLVHANVPLGEYMAGVATGDFDLDGTIELVIFDRGYCDWQGGRISVMTDMSARRWSLFRGYYCAYGEFAALHVSSSRDAQRPLFALLQPSDPDGVELVVNRPLPTGGYVGLVEYHQLGAWNSKPVAVDLSSSGRLDVLVCLGASALYFEALPNGSYAPPVAMPVRGYPFAVDLNGDGLTDLVAPDGRSRPSVTLVYLAHLGPSYDPPVAYPQGGVVASGDIDGNGSTDLLVWRDAVGFSSLINDGTGVFEQLGPSWMPDFGLRPPDSWGDVVMGDCDDDGLADIAFGVPLSCEGHGSDRQRDAKTELIVMRNTRGGHFTPWASAIVDRCGRIDLELGDLDGDGDLDAALGASFIFPDRGNSGGVGIFLSQGHGVYQLATTLGLIGDLSVGDMTGDGLADIARLHSGDYNGSWTYGINLNGRDFVSSSMAVQASPSCPSLVDMNGDGMLDYVFAVSTGGQVPGGLSSTTVAYNSLPAPRGAVPATRAHARRSRIEAKTPGGLVQTPQGQHFALRVLGPNPSLGDMAVSLSLEPTAPGILELLDVSGRRLAVRTLQPGWSGTVRDLASGQVLSPGLYWLRLMQDERSTWARVVVVE